MTATRIFRRHKGLSKVCKKGVSVRKIVKLKNHSLSTAKPSENDAPGSSMCDMTQLVAASRAVKQRTGTARMLIDAHKKFDYPFNRYHVHSGQLYTAFLQASTGKPMFSSSATKAVFNWMGSAITERINAKYAQDRKKYRLFFNMVTTFLSFPYRQFRRHQADPLHLAACHGPAES